MMKPLKITVEFPTITVTIADGIISLGGEGVGLVNNKKLHEALVHWFDHHRGLREVLGLKTGESLFERLVCPEKTIQAPSESAPLNLKGLSKPVEGTKKNP